MIYRLIGVFFVVGTIFLSCATNIGEPKTAFKNEANQEFLDTSKYTLCPSNGCSGLYVIGNIDSVYSVVIEGQYESLSHGVTYILDSDKFKFHIIETSKLSSSYCNDVQLIGAQIGSSHEDATIKIIGSMIIRDPISEYSLPLAEVYIDSIKCTFNNIKVQTDNIKFLAVDVFSVPG